MSIRRHTALLGIIVVIGLAFFVATIVKVMDPYEVEVTKTSDNTWRIYDPNNDPERYIERTCATEGREVAQLQSTGSDYSTLNVVCATTEGALS